MSIQVLSNNPKAIKARAWKDANPERYAEHQLAYRKRNRLPCRHCKGPMPFPSPGAGYCSKDCSSEAARLDDIKRRRKLQKELEDYKCSIGCSVCGYNICGAALDFHHPDENKERRITVRGWKTPVEQAEIAKCILLCSNHHREEHARLRPEDVL